MDDKLCAAIVTTLQLARPFLIKPELSCGVSPLKRWYCEFTSTENLIARNADLIWFYLPRRILTLLTRKWVWILNPNSTQKSG